MHVYWKYGILCLCNLLFWRILSGQLFLHKVMIFLHFTIETDENTSFCRQEGEVSVEIRWFLIQKHVVFMLFSKLLSLLFLFIGERAVAAHQIFFVCVWAFLF